jgi:hypothetical protein
VNELDEVQDRLDALRLIVSSASASLQNLTDRPPVSPTGWRRTVELVTAQLREAFDVSAPKCGTDGCPKRAVGMMGHCQTHLDAHRDRINGDRPWAGLRPRFPELSPARQEELVAMLTDAYLRGHEAGTLDVQRCGDWPAPCNCDDPTTHGGH